MTDFEPTTVCELTISATIIKKFSGKLKRLFCKNLGFNCFVAIKLFFAVTYGSVNYGRLLYYALVKQNAICYFKPTSKSLISKICECLSKSFTALSSSVLKIYSRIVSSKFQKSYLHIFKTCDIPKILTDLSLPSPNNQEKFQTKTLTNIAALLKNQVCCTLLIL